MGNNSTSDIKDEDNTVEAAKKTHLDDVHEYSLKEEDQIVPKATSEYADTKTAEMVSVDTSEPEREISQEDTHEDCVKEENQKDPTTDANIVLENAAKASNDTTFELEKDMLPEEIQTDDLKEKIQTVPAAEGKDVEDKDTSPASDHSESVSEKDSFKEETHEGGADMECQKHSTAGDEDVQEKDTELASHNTRSKHERDSLEGDTCKEDVNVDENPTAEPDGTDVQEMDARLALDDEASDPKNYITQEDIHAIDKDESSLVLFGGGTNVPEKSIILDSDDALDLRDTYEKEILEARQPEESPNAESVEDSGEKCEILSSSSLEGTEDLEKQTESCLRKNILVTVTDHHHLDSEPTPEEEDTIVSALDALDMSNEAELQESPVVDSNHKELAEVLPESSPSESWPKGDFLDTNPLCPQHDDDVIERETQAQEKNVSSDMSEVSDVDKPESSLGDLSGTESDSPSGIKINGNSLTKINYISDDFLNSISGSVNEANPLMLDFEENNKVLHEEGKMSRSGSTKENSHDHNLGECIVNKNDMITVSNGDCNGERNEVERPEATENGHHFDACDENTNMISDDTITVSEQEHILILDVDVVPLITVSTVVDCREEERDNYKKKIEEIYNEPEDSHASENGFVGIEMLEQCNSHLVTTEHVESFTLQSSDSLLHIYSYQEGIENQTKNLTAMETSDWKQENDEEALEKEMEDYYSQHVEATSTNSVFENGAYYETESTTRLSTESNPDCVTIFSQMQKSPSFNLNLQNGESSEESDQSPLLSHQTSQHIMDSWPHSENGHCILDHEEMPMEEKIVTMERSYNEKSNKVPLMLCYSKEDGETSLLVSSQEQGSHVDTYNAVKDQTSTSPKQKEKRKSMSNFFINCMCCSTVAN